MTTTKDVNQSGPLPERAKNGNGAHARAGEG